MLLGVPCKDDKYVHGENVMKLQVLLCVFKGL